jgi:hypothetical protein
MNLKIKLLTGALAISLVSTFAQNKKKITIFSHINTLKQAEALAIPASTVYAFSTFTAAYQTFTGTPLSNTRQWDEATFTIPLGFNIKLYNKINDTLFIQGGSGISLDTTSALSTIASPILEDLCDRAWVSATSNEGDPGGISNISYNISGTAGSRIVKIQVSNAGFWNEIDINMATVSFINYQIWLYEGSGIVEFRYGNTSITNIADNFALGAQGFVCGMFQDFDFSTNPPNSNMLNGTFSSPSHVGLDMSNPPTSIPAISNANLNNRVYRFTYATGAVTSLNAITNSIFNYDVYPNPSNNLIHVNVGDDVLNHVEVYTISGSLALTSKEKQLNVAALANGLYVAKIYTDKGISYKKIIKE